MPSLTIGSVLLLAFVAWARWDMVWRDPERLPMSRLAWILLGMFTLLIVVRGVGIAYADVDTSLLTAILCLGVLVGFSEELLFRGIFLRCMRNGQMSEGAVALCTVAGLEVEIPASCGFDPEQEIAVFNADDDPIVPE